MAKSQVFKFFIPVKYVASVNKLHIPVIKRVGGKPTPLIVKSPEAREAMEDYRKSLAYYLPKEKFGDKKKFTNLDVVYGFYLKEKFYKRDASNAIKIFEDALSHYIGFNDSQVINVHSYKRLLDNNGASDVHEFVYACITTNVKKNKDLMIDPRTLPHLGFLEIKEIDSDGEEPAVRKPRKTRKK